MEIRLVSSLNPDDEFRLAPAVLEALGVFLNQLPIAYTLRVETADGKGFSHHHLPVRVPPPYAADLDLSAVGAKTHA